jgi:ATP-binding cassette subfamily B protein
MLIAALYMMMAHMSWKLAIAGLGPLIVIPVIVRYYGPRIKAQSAKLQATLGVMSQSVEEIIAGIRTVKAFGNEKVIINRFENHVENILVERMKFVRLSSIFTALIPFMASIGFIVVIGYGGYLTINNAISLGDFVAFLLYLILLRQPLEMLGNTLNVIQRGSASLARISDLLEAPRAVYNHRTATIHKPVHGDIEVKNLSFRYPGTQKDVLSDVSFTVKQGQTLGIIGTIGSGKTSLAHLLMRVYEPPRGTIFIDGVDVQDYYLKDLRQSVAYVPQNGFLFSTTINENIAFAEEIIDEEKVISSAKISAVHEDIQKLKEMYATEIGERGVRLSGGQKQRVAIARLIYKDSPVNVLDDSLSAVDTKTERLIFLNMQKYRKTKGHSKTNIIISHRLSAVIHADEIIILDQGRITDRGNHQQLLKTSELYGKLWILQSGGEGRSEPILPELSSKTELLEVLLEEDDDDEKVKSTEGGGYGS